MTEQTSQPELDDDIEIIGPGTMLKEGREKLKLSQSEVAKRLNFKLSLVGDIENENFPSDVPSTFTRGYLKNYAKLVQVPVEEVLASFEMLGVARTQGAEMQSFSRQTEKQAENSRLMLLSYLIVFILIGLTVMWWYQNKQQTSDNVVIPPNAVEIETTNDATDTTPELDSTQTQLAQQALDELVESVDLEESVIESATLPVAEIHEPLEPEQPIEDSSQITDNIALGEAVTVVFNFAENCWVNISDSTGERIAYGMKNSGYEMTISGIPPFSITLGRPEQVSISYDGQTVDMSRFTAGHIAKFELPLNE